MAGIMLDSENNEVFPPEKWGGEPEDEQGSGLIFWIVPVIVILFVLFILGAVYILAHIPAAVITVLP